MKARDPSRPLLHRTTKKPDKGRGLLQEVTATLMEWAVVHGGLSSATATSRLCPCSQTLPFGRVCVMEKVQQTRKKGFTDS